MLINGGFIQFNGICQTDVINVVTCQHTNVTCIYSDITYGNIRELQVDYGALYKVIQDVEVEILFLGWWRLWGPIIPKNWVNNNDSFSFQETYSSFMSVYHVPSNPGFFSSSSFCSSFCFSSSSLASSFSFSWKHPGSLYDIIVQLNSPGTDYINPWISKGLTYMQFT